MRALPNLATLAVVAAPAGAFAADYMSVEQAARAMFPEAERFDPADVTLSAGQMKRLDDTGVRARSARWAIRAARRGEAVLGWVVTDEVIGKFELISYAVGIALDGSIRQVEVLSYRESHGSEVRLPAWRRQFAGLRAADPIELGRDIANISGATLSCRHLTEGIKRIATLTALLRTDGQLR